nr:aminotransferase [Actinomycetota bacterium]NIS29361.1 aminotransferase [Actinomycetota bacterium]NIU64044.1 aminotransferase [Actinomycetota bacterium]NIW26527.1 aminotransferase [Actinomycetota bacterium]
MARGLRAIAIEGVDVSALGRVAEELLRHNGLAEADATVYLQVTRGAAPRLHAFPDPPVPPTVYAVATPF